MRLCAGGAEGAGGGQYGGDDEAGDEEAGDDAQPAVGEPRLRQQPQLPHTGRGGEGQEQDSSTRGAA